MSPLTSVRLAAYTTAVGEDRVLEAIRNQQGGLRLHDLPATGEGDRFLVEPDVPDVEELRAIVMDYLAQTELSGLVPMDLRRIYPDAPGWVTGERDAA